MQINVTQLKKKVHRKQKQNNREQPATAVVGVALMALARASGGDVLTTTISRGSDPSTTPVTAGILGYRFSAFWLTDVSLRAPWKV